MRVQQYYQQSDSGLKISLTSSLIREAHGCAFAVKGRKPEG